MSLIYGSVCSGIEAATVAWKPLGFNPAFFCEIDKNCSVVLRHHYPTVPNYGNLVKLANLQTYKYVPKIDILIGGTPCQAFSIAGQRRGIADPRGALTEQFFRLAERIRPRWIVWENVPGVLSIDKGRVFGDILQKLEQCRYGYAWRVLDAQHFGVPQRRRRVYVVGCIGNWKGAAAVLSFQTGLSGNSESGRTQKEQIKGILPTFKRRSGTYREEEAYIAGKRGIRLLTCEEYERGQGFPSGYTDIRGMSITGRKAMVGNSMAVPVVNWIGRGISIVDPLL